MRRVRAKSPAGPSSRFRQAAPYQGRFKTTNIGLAGPGVGLYRLAMKCGERCRTAGESLTGTKYGSESHQVAKWRATVASKLTLPRTGN